MHPRDGWIHKLLEKRKSINMICFRLLSALHNVSNLAFEVFFVVVVTRERPDTLSTGLSGCDESRHVFGTVGESANVAVGERSHSTS